MLYFLEYLKTHSLCKDEEEKSGKYGDTMRQFLAYISESIIASNEQYVAPVIIAHSFGGLTAMKLLERLKKDTKEPLLSSMALLCSVPPSGITKMSLRALRKNPARGWRIMQGLAMKKAVSNPKLCRQLFFDEEVSDEKLNTYMTKFQEDSRVTMDLKDLSNKLPMHATDEDGCSTYIKNGVLQAKGLVIGGTEDYIVDSEAVKETATFLCASSKMVDGAVHDIMLTNCWLDVAKELEVWLNSVVNSAESAYLPQ